MGRVFPIDRRTRNDLITPWVHTHIADWLDPMVNKWTKVTLKQIDDTQSHDFYQVKIISHANC